MTRPPNRQGGRVRLRARWVLAHEAGRHVLLDRGEIVFQDGAIVFAGHAFPGEVAVERDYGNALIGPGFIDLDALSDLDTTILAYDNQPGLRRGRVWPRSYMDRGPYEMYTPAELEFQKRHAFATLIRNGITTALPIASLFYRAWGETPAEFADAARAAIDLGLRVYLGPAYRAGNMVAEEDGQVGLHFDESRGLSGLDDAIAFCRTHENTGGGLVRTMLAPDRIETCTPALLSRTAAAGRDLEVPVRLHCCQSAIEVELVRRQHGMSPPEWLRSMDFLTERTLLPHGIHVAGDDLSIIAGAGAAIVHCPLVSGRHGNAIAHWAQSRALGLRMGMGTDTSPPDMIANMQAGMILRRVLSRDVSACRSEDYYDMATTGGADALARPDLGRLAPGCRADITVFDLDRPHLGQVIDPVQTMMLAGHGRDFHTVIIDGRFVMEDRVIPGVDEAADTLRAQRQFEGLMAKYPERTLGHPPVSEIFSSSYQIRSAGAAPAAAG